VSHGAYHLPHEMFIGIAGPICSGKRTIANFLISNHQFTRLRLQHVGEKSSSYDNEFDALNTPAPTPPVDEIHNLSNGIHKVQVSSNKDIWFESMVEMVGYVTKRWRQNFVTVDIWTEKDLEIVVKRPFFLLVSVDAPITVRWKRFYERFVCPSNTEFNRRCLKSGKLPPSLEEFVMNSDTNIYSPEGIMTLLQRATVRIINPHNTISELYLTLTHANLLDASRLRPSWDSYFMHLADLAARRSNCMKRRVGCVLVRGGRVISTGYNGTPRGLRNCNEGGCLRCNMGEGSGQALSSCLCMHAEVSLFASVSSV
jgi:dCMP deaminase